MQIFTGVIAKVGEVKKLLAGDIGRNGRGIGGIGNDFAIIEIDQGFKVEPGVPERLPELPKRATPNRDFDFSFLSDGEPWLLVRGVDFEPEVTLATLRRRIRDCAEREGYSRQRGLPARDARGGPSPGHVPRRSDVQGGTQDFSVHATCFGM
jgi:hypothetical protein